MGDPYIPRFILREFSINPTEEKYKQKIMIFEDGIIKTKRIADAYQVKNLYTRDAETLFANLENKVARIRKRIIKNVSEGSKVIELSKEDYILLVRFNVIMWRRNTVQQTLRKKRAKDVIAKMPRHTRLKEYQNLTNDEMLAKMPFDQISKKSYESIIRNTNADDPTVLKTLMYYSPHLLVNETDSAFPLHNLYGTVVRMSKDGQIAGEEFPDILIEPLSKKIYMIYFRRVNVLKKTIKIGVEREPNPEQIKRIINYYLVTNYSSIVIDESNQQIIKSLLIERGTTHHMRLWDEAFEKVSSGTKTIEMRLYDDKRKKIQVGDKIQFLRVSDDSKIFVRVTNLHIKINFNDLYDSLDKEDMGYENNDTADPDDMLDYYTKEEIGKYGVVGIEFEVGINKMKKNNHLLPRFIIKKWEKDEAKLYDKKSKNVREILKNDYSEKYYYSLGKEDDILENRIAKFETVIGRILKRIEDSDSSIKLSGKDLELLKLFCILSACRQENTSPLIKDDESGIYENNNYIFVSVTFFKPINQQLNQV